MNWRPLLGSVSPVQTRRAGRPFDDEAIVRVPAPGKGPSRSRAVMGFQERRLAGATTKGLALYPASLMDPYDNIPDVRDGLTRQERIVLYVLHETQNELGGRNVPTAMLWGRVCELLPQVHQSRRRHPVSSRRGGG